MSFLAKVASRPRTSGGGDPFYSDVLFLLHMFGTNGSTTITDNGPSPKTWTAAGNAAITTAQYAYSGSGSSLYLDGAGDYVSTPDNAAWDIGTSDFTLEGWFRFDGTIAASYTTLLSQYSVTNVGIVFEYDLPTTDLRLYNGDTSIADSASWTPTTATWYHLAVCRSGTSIRIFINGVQSGSTVTSAANFTASPSAFSVGANTSGAALAMKGWVNDARYTKAARYTANFTPPTAPFPDS